jgi:hypothetical protein
MLFDKLRWFAMVALLVLLGSMVCQQVKPTT